MAATIKAHLIAHFTVLLRSGSRLGVLNEDVDE